MSVDLQEVERCLRCLESRKIEFVDAATLGLTDREPLAKVIMRLIANPQRNSHNILITPRLTPLEAAQLRLLLNTGVSIFAVALLWDEEDATTLGTAAALGCQVAGVRPGDDLSAVLYQSGVAVA